jgi:hypothetical protein
MKVTINKLQNYILLAVVFTGILSNYPYVNNINNIFIVLLFVSSFFTKSSSTKSIIFILFSAIVSISIFNQLFYFFIQKFDLVKEDTIIFSIFLVMYAVNRIKIIYTFDFLVLINMLIFPFLFLFGFELMGGRLVSSMISLNMVGIYIFIGLMVSGQYLIKGKYKILSSMVFISSMFYLAVSGARKDLILLAMGVVFLFIFIKNSKDIFKRYRIFKKTILTFIIIAIGTIFISNALQNLQSRFGDNYNVMAQINGEEDEHSASQRVMLISSAMVLTAEYPFGVGMGNIRQAMDKYNLMTYPTNHMDSIIGESLYTAGFMGLLIYIMIIYQLYRVLKYYDKEKKYRYILFYMIISIPIYNILFHKIFWMLLVILEKELKNRGQKV